MAPRNRISSRTYAMPSAMLATVRGGAVFVARASRYALLGLGVAVTMGVVFGLLIGVGGLVLGVEIQRLYIIGGLSGWVSGFIAMVFIFVQMRRTHYTRS